MDGYYEVDEKDCKPCITNFCKKCDSNGLCIECENKELDPSNCREYKVVVSKESSPF